MNTQNLKIAFACLAVLVTAPLLRAGTIIKTNNTDNLNLTTSWVGGVVPGSLDTARWDSTVTGANSVALGADTTWSGILIANPGGAVTINAGNTLTLGTNGINMSGATQNLTIGSGLTLGGGLQTWNVTNATSLTASGTFTRPVGTALAVGSTSVATAGQGTVTASPALENGILPWATAQSSGTAANGSVAGNTFATVSGGNIVAYTNANAETTAGTGVSFGGIPTGDNSTLNYDLAVNSTGAVMSADTYVNSLRNIGGAYLQPGTANFRANAIMNAGTGPLIISTPVQQADTGLNELVLAEWTAGTVFSNIVSDNVNPLHITTTGSSSNIFTALNTFSGGITINSGRVGIRISSVPLSGTPTSGPLGTGTITMNGGALFSSVGSYGMANPVVIGPGGGQFQFNGAQPDLSINGNITGSGPITMNGIFNQNGLFFNGDDSAYNGIVTVAGSNNRLGNTNSGSIYAKWVINGGLAAQLVGGGTYEMGELSGSTGGCLCGHAVNSTPSIQEWVVGFLNTSTSYLGIFADNANSSACGNSDGSTGNLVALTKVGSGTLTLGGNSTASGPVHIYGGSVVLGTNGASGKLGVNAVITDNANLTINRSNAVVQGVDFSGVAISGNGSLTQAGSGATTLNAANTYTGGTTVSRGTLFVNGPILGTATVMSGGTLSGAGSIDGVVTVQSGGTLAAGPTATTIGTLTLNNTPVLGGSVFVRINPTTAQSDQFVLSGVNTANYTGTLVVSNTGGPLLAGDSFTIFTAAYHNGNFGSIQGNPGAGLAYSFNNGILSVVSTGGAYATNSTPTNVTATLSRDLGGNQTVAVAWPSDHLGWVLQSQTNDVDGGLGSNWFDLPATATVNLMNVTNPTDLAVYYRMRLVPPPAPAGAPTGLTAKPTNTAVILSWTAPSYARSYNIWSSTTSGAETSNPPVANTIATIYTNTGLANGTTYYYQVSALNQFGQSALSSEVSATPQTAPLTAPTNLTAQAASGLVGLTWSNVTSATSYNVKRGTASGGPYPTVVNVTANNFLDNTVANGTTYYYVVSALNLQLGSPVESPNSSEVSATPQPVPPQPPTGLTATAQYLQVRLNWAASFGASSYNVYYATTSGGPYTLFGNVTTPVDYVTGLTAGTPYYFVVTAVNGIGESGNSSEATATPTATLPLQYDFENTSTNYSVTLPPLPTPGTFTYIYPLPDPFYYVSDPLNMGGTGSTNFSDWEHHRAEILAEIQTYEIGTKPTVSLSMESASISGSGTTRTLTVVVTNVVSGTNRILTLTASMTLPSASGTFPLCIGMNGPNGSVNSSLLTSVAKMTYTINQVTTYGGKAATDPFYVLYAAPYTPAIETVHTGQYAAWSWGCSRLVDGLYKLNGNLGGGVQIDLTRIMVTGCSYAGKMALFCGAFDERVTLTIAQESGGGGANSWRYNEFNEPAGTVEDIDNTDYGWFGAQMHNFGLTNVVYLPEDHHMLDSLVAPRALFMTGNPSQIWLGSASFYVCSQAAIRVWNNFGLSDRVGYNNDQDHAHCATQSSIDAEMGTYINKFLLLQTNLNSVIRDDGTYYTNGLPNAGQWTTWWGTTNAILGP